MISSPHTSLLCFCPRICSTQNTLEATTGLSTILATLGLSLRRVVLARAERTVTLEERIAWVRTRQRVLRFDQIAAVTYGYEDKHPLGWVLPSHDPLDCFVVGLLLVGGEEVRLFNFVGDGAFVNDTGLPDWWYWEEYLFDRSGGQEGESLMFVQLLSQLMGVSVTPSTLTSRGFFG